MRPTEKKGNQAVLNKFLKSPVVRSPFRYHIFVCHFVEIIVAMTSTSQAEGTVSGIGDT